MFKKRIIALFTVMVFAVSCFSISCFALNPVVEYLFDCAVEDIINGDNLDWWLNMYKTKTGEAVDNLTSEQKQQLISGLAGEHSSDYDTFGNDTIVNAITYTFSGYNGDITFSREYIINQIYKNDKIDVSGYKWFTIYANDSAGDYICTYFFPQNTNCKLHMTRTDYENHTFNRNTNPHSYLTDWEPVKYAYCYGRSFYISTYNYKTSAWSAELNLRDLVGSGANNPLYIMYNDLQSEFIDESPAYHWESTIEQNGNNVTTTISCIADKEIEGPIQHAMQAFSLSSGIVYHDVENDVHGYPSADYLIFDDVDYETDYDNGILYRKTYTFNLKALEQIRKRKKLDSDNCFYIFNNVMKDYQSVHYRQQLVDWGSVDDGIFSDTEDIPIYQIPPLIDLPSILPYGFDYSPTTYTTINNYNGTDFDFESFFGWFQGSFVAMANNMGAFFANAQNFMAAFADFEVNGTLNAIANIGSLIDDLNLNLNSHFENIGDYINNISNAFDTNLKILFDNINNEFNGSIGTVGKLTDAIDFNFDNITNSISSYIGDLISTINNNTETVVDNVNDKIENTFVPDKVYLEWVMQNAIPWYYQIRNALQDTNFATDSVSLTIDFGEILGVQSITYDDAQTASRIRTILEMILIASTVVGCGRLGFQILGIDISKAKGGE